MSLSEPRELLPGSTERRRNSNFSAFAMPAVSYLSNGTSTCHGSSGCGSTSSGSGCCTSGRLINRHSNDYNSRQLLQTIQQKLPLRQTLRQQKNNGNINVNYKLRNNIKVTTTSSSSAVAQLVRCPAGAYDVASYSPYSSCGRLKQRRKLKTLLPTNVPASAYALTGLVLLCSALLSPCHAFQLDGSQNSFAQFRKWYTGLNGSLELEFKTEQPNGLVLYTDDGGTYDFFELKLVEGALRLRYNLGGGAHIITVGRELHDAHWHKVQVSGWVVRELVHSINLWFTSVYLHCCNVNILERCRYVCRCCATMNKHR